MHRGQSLRSLVFAATSGLLLVACGGGKDQPSTADRALEELQARYERLTDGGKDAVDWAKEDLENIGDWEYRILELPAASPDELEARLNELGNERWEAFWVQYAGPDLRILLKRPSISYISKVPFSQLRHIVPESAGSE